MSIPKCEVPGCCNPAQLTTSLANPKYRKSKWVREEYGVENGYVCGKHHSRKVAENRGMNNIAEVVAANAGFSSVREHQEHQARENGFETIADWKRDLDLKSAKASGFATIAQWKNSKHPYRWYLSQQPTCENVDGRLGFVCTTTTFVGYGMVDVDHKNGDPSDNRVENLQSLCKCCHAYKTNTSKDYSTPGRKTLKIAA
jgi:hypothetical protein